MSDAEGFPCGAGHRHKHKATQGDFSYACGFACLLSWSCAHTQKHRFPYRKQTQSRHLELHHRANLNEIVGNRQESERLYLPVELHQRKHDVKVCAVLPT